MADRFAAAVAALRRGALIVYPTDTLFGLGASATSAGAVDRLSAAKGRPPGMATSVTLSSVEELERFGRLAPAGRAFARAHLPGPYTLLVPARTHSGLVPALRAADGTIGLRVPAHPVARELARRAGPITATSANRHGAPPSESLPGARRAFGDDVAVYLGGAPGPTGRPSTLVDLSGPTPRVVARRRTGR